MDPTQPVDPSPSRTVAAGHHRAAGCDVARLAVVTDQAHSSVQGQEATSQEATSQEARSQEVTPQEATPREAIPGTIAWQIEAVIGVVHIRLSQHNAKYSGECNFDDHQALMARSTPQQTERK